MPNIMDNGGNLLIEMQVFWYEDSNCGSTRCINYNHLQGRAFVSMQHFGQSNLF